MKHLFKRIMIIFSMTLMMGQWQVALADEAAFNATQKQAIEKIIENYLLNNPEILLKVSKILQEKQQSDMLAKAQSAIAQNMTQIFEGSSPVIGNKSGKVTIVEFFDYQCVHCKKMSATISQIIKENPEVRVVFKQFPIFGDASAYAAQAALASQKQGKYEAFHKALLAAEGRLDKRQILAIAKKVGLNTKKLQRDMQDPAIMDELKTNMQLADQMGIMGTPAFIVATNPAQKDNVRYYPGAADLNTLKQLIASLNKNETGQ